MKKEIVLNRRKDIQLLQDLLIEDADGENIEGDGKNIVHSKNFPLKHTFADGIYIRQMDMQAGEKEFLYSKIRWMRGIFTIDMPGRPVDSPPEDKVSLTRNAG